MTKESKWWESDAVKTIEVIAAIIGILSALGILQYFGTIDFLNPISAFLTTNILYILVLIIVILVILICFLFMKRRSKTVRAESQSECSLDLQDARRIALLCQTPRTTDFLRQQYDYWQRQSSVVVLGGFHFNDYMSMLEKEGHLVYRDNMWHVTYTAIEYLAKYHGGD
jgi:hypothetical protein